MSDNWEKDIHGSQRAYPKLSSRINLAPLWLPERSFSPNPHEGPSDYRGQSSKTTHRSSSRPCSIERPADYQESLRDSQVLQVRFASSKTSFNGRSSRRSESDMLSFRRNTERLSISAVKPTRANLSSERLAVQKPGLYSKLPDESVRLYRTNKEREYFDNLSDLYALINSIEQLEKAFIRGCIIPTEYTSACSRLLFQYKTAFELVQCEELPTVEKFMEHYRFECSQAIERIKEDRPMTIHDSKANLHKYIADIVALYMTIMDKLRLEMTAVDEIQPEMRNLIDTMNMLGTNLPADFEGKVQVAKWLRLMSSMNTSDRFNGQQVRQILFEMDEGYSAFLKVLHEFS